MARRNKITAPSMRKLNEKLSGAGVRVKHYVAPRFDNEDLGKNRNGAHTSNASKTQGYDKETRQYTKTASRTKSGRLAPEGETNAKNGETWTFTPKNDDKSRVLKKDGTPRQSGRSTTSKRRLRDYDVRVGMNNTEAAVNNVGGYEGLKARGLTDDEIRNIYGYGANGQRVAGHGLATG